VAEWFKALVLKTSVGETPPWVRIPPLPPNLYDLTAHKIMFFMSFLRPRRNIWAPDTLHCYP